MAKGGYQILDFSGINFDPYGETRTIDSKYYGMINNSTKPIYITNLVVNGVRVPDFYGDFKFNNFNYTYKFDIPTTQVLYNSVGYTSYSILVGENFYIMETE